MRSDDPFAEPDAGHVLYFGYGSLVNRATRPDGERAWPATLRGWRRTWNHRVPASDARIACTSLSIDPAIEGDVIAGVVVRMPLAALPGLDAREANYDRLALPMAAFGLPPGLAARSGGERVYAYRSVAARREPAGAAHPILASYVDCIMAGYLERHGEAGLRDWIASTDGWEAPRLDDRADPAYPRAVRLPAALLERFDALLPSAPVQRAPA